MGKIETVIKSQIIISPIFSFPNSNSNPPKVYAVVNPHFIQNHFKYRVLLIIIISTRGLRDKKKK